MPQRPRAHQIEDLSRRAFESTLGPRFVYRNESDPREYGIDGTVEEFEEHPPHLATGLRFHVQLKATDEPNLSRSLAESIGRATADYYRSLTLPVLMVRYRADDETLYARWFHQFDPTDSRMTRTVTFRWEPEDRLGPDGPSRLVSEARAFLTLRSPALRLPLDVYLDVGAEGAHGLGRAVLQTALRNSVSAVPDVVFLRSGPIPAGAIRLATTTASLTANLGNVTTATVLLDRYSPGEIGEQFGIDAMVVLALAFEYVGRTDVATRLATAFLARSSLVTAPEVAWGLAFALRRSRRVPEALRLADSLDTSEEADRREASKPFLIAALWHRGSLETDELDQLEAVLERRVAREIGLGNELAGRTQQLHPRKLAP